MLPLRSLSFVLLAAMAAPAFAQFTWNTEFVAPTHCDDRECALAIGPSGAVHALFFHDNTTGGRGLLHYSRRAPGGGWSSPIDVAGSAFHGASLALRPGEVPFAAYSNGADESERIRELSNAGVFNDFGTPLTGGQFWKGGQGGRVLVDSQGRPSLAYFYGPGEDARFSEWTGAGWNTVTVESYQRVGKGVRATRLADGRPALAYFNQDTHRVHYSERAAAGSWSVLTSFANANPMDLQAAPNGGAYLLLTPDNVSTPIALYQGVGTMWTQDLAFPGATYGYAQIWVDGAGGLHAVATDLLGRVDYLRRVAGAWQTYSVASGLQGGRYAELIVSAAGDPMIAFTRIVDDAFVCVRGASTSAGPVMTAITPEGGPASGGTVITITGQNFVANATSATIGGVPAAVANVTPTSITCTAPVGLALGDNQIIVTTPSGTTTQLQGPDGSADALFWSGYKLAHYGIATPGFGGQAPLLDVDFANSTPTNMHIVVSNTLPLAHGALAGDFHHEGLPQPVFGVPGQTGPLWLNVYPSWFQTVPLLASGAIVGGVGLTSKVIKAVLAGAEGLPVVADASGTCSVVVPVWPHLALPGAPSVLSFQAFVEDPAGVEWRRGEALGITLNAIVAWKLGAGATLGAFALNGTLYALDQLFIVTGQSGAGAANTLVQNFIDHLEHEPLRVLRVLPTIVSILVNAVLPNPHYSASAGLEVTYYGP